MVKLYFGKSLKVKHESLKVDEKDIGQRVELPKLMNLVNFLVTSVTIVVANYLRFDHFI
jgi:hypothetical protein